MEISRIFCVSLFQQLFRRLVNKSRLGGFWQSVVKRYGRDAVRKLDASKIAYLIRASEERNETCSNIALQLGVTRRRVEQILAEHRKSGCAPVLRKPGRKSVPITEKEVSAILDAYSRYKTNALYLERMIEDETNIHINHNRIHKVLLMNSLAGRSRKKWIRRKWVRYEREHSNSLWHTDWHAIKDRKVERAVANCVTRTTPRDSLPDLECMRLPNLSIPLWHSRMP